MKCLTIPLLAALHWPVAQAEQYPFSGCFDIASRAHNIELDLLLAVAWVESRWDPDARSSANAHGLMQIRWPVTARHLGTRRVAELYNPCLNINMGARYLQELLQKYQQNTRLALAAYHYGPTRIRDVHDIPDRVHAYVNLVTREQARMSAELSESTPGNRDQQESIELIRFERRSRARRYVAAMKQAIPDLELNIKQLRTVSVVHLDPGSLTTSARYRLNNLLPDLWNRTNTVVHGKDQTKVHPGGTDP